MAKLKIGVEALIKKGTKEFWIKKRLDISMLKLHINQ